MSGADVPVAAAPSSDGELVRRVLAGEREAFSALVTRHQAALYRHARGMGIDPDAAQDLVQDAFVKAYLRLGQCRDPERFFSWVFRVFRNLALDWLRDVRRREAPLEILGHTRAADGDVDRHEIRDAVARALAELPEILRETFLLRHRMDCSYEEIAELTGASLSAAKMRVVRAREALRRALGAVDVADDVTDGAERPS